MKDKTRTHSEVTENFDRRICRFLYKRLSNKEGTDRFKYIKIIKTKTKTVKEKSAVYAM